MAISPKLFASVITGLLLIRGSIGETIENNLCQDQDYSLYFDPQYSYLYKMLEESLLNNTEALQALRIGFTSTDKARDLNRETVRAL